MRYRVLVYVLMLLFVADVGIGAGSEGLDDREASYLGASWVDHELNEECSDGIGEEECPVRFPRGVLTAVCDGDGHPWVGGMVDGIGGVVFCEISHGSTIRLTMEDEVFAVPEAVVTCFWDDHYAEDHSHYEYRILAYLEGSAIVTVPHWCNSDDGMYTNVVVFNAMGKAVEGRVHLEFLEGH